VSDVDDAHDAENKRHTQGDHSIDAAGQEPAHDSLKKHGPGDVNRHGLTFSEYDKGPR
jgi:hypothetical protein